MKKYKVGIIGSGKVGRALSIALTKQNYDVCLVCNNHSGIHIDNKCEFSMRGDLGDATCLVTTASSVSCLSDDLDVIIITTRSYDTINIISDCMQKIKDSGCIVTIQNVFTIDKISKLIPSDKSVCAYLDINCNSIKDSLYVTDFNGITLGVYDRLAYEKMEMVKEILSSICEIHITKDIVGFALGRNIINGAISMLGAISGLPLGEILEDKNGEYLFTKIITEAVGVIKRFRINIVPYNDKLDYYRFCENIKYRKSMLKLLKVNNKDVTSSALKDIQRGKKPELSYALGIIMEYGSKFKMDISYISVLYEIFKDIQDGKREIDKQLFYDEKITKLKGR